MKRSNVIVLLLMVSLFAVSLYRGDAIAAFFCDPTIPLCHSGPLGPPPSGECGPFLSGLANCIANCGVPGGSCQAPY
jgi:hypothetical protein